MDPTTPQAQCTDCFDNYPVSLLTTFPCHHNSCPACLSGRLSYIIEENYRHPMRCCNRPLPDAQLQKHLPPADFRKYLEKRLETTTADPLYCHVNACSAWIKPQSMHNGVGFCQECNAKTCVECKKESHFGTCGAALEDRSLKDLAEQSGWKACPGCRRMIEKVEGCPSIM